MQTEGYIVLPSVFSASEADETHDLMWKWVERTAPNVKRAEPDSWWNSGGVDPWPHKQRDMMQLHQAGWLLTDLREKFVDRIFAPMFGTQQLHVSKDGFTMQRPTDGTEDLSANDHFDQGSLLRGLQCA